MSGPRLPARLSAKSQVEHRKHLQCELIVPTGMTTSVHAGILMVLLSVSIDFLNEDKQLLS